MLSDSSIRALKPENGKPKRKADRDGLMIEARPSGKKIFIFRFQWEKKPQTMTLGYYPTLSLAEARVLASNYREQVNKEIDPRNDEVDAQSKLTFREAAELWHQKNAHCWKPVTSNRHYKSLIRDVYPLIGNKPIDNIIKTDLLGLIHPHEMQGHHEIAHRLHARLQAIFEFSVGASLTENYPFIGLKKALAAKPPTKNQPAIHPESAHAMLDKIKCSRVSKITKIYVELLAHLFTRPAELRLAQWSEFNLQQGEWHIPVERMKMAAAHWVPLSAYVIKLLKELRAITGFTQYLFSSPITKKLPISEASGRKLLHSLGYKNKHTLHGFRALASSVLHEYSHFRSDAIEAQLVHKVQGVRGVYLRADFKHERKQLMDWYSNWLLNANSLSDKNQFVGGL